MNTEKINKKEMDAFFEMLKATVSCGHEQAQADAHLEPVQTGRATAGITAEGSAVRESLGKGAGIVLAPPAGLKIPLSQGQVALVDPEDYERVAAFKWYARRKRYTWYAVRNITVNGKQRPQQMHRFILGIDDPSVEVDHRNRNGLINQRYNLRSCTHGQNQANTAKRPGFSSQFKGVSWQKNGGGWRASIKQHGKKIELGNFPDPVLAAKAYDAAALEYFGEFAVLNFPAKPYQGNSEPSADEREEIL